MRALPRPGIESMSPALVGSSYPLCYQGDPDPLSYFFFFEFTENLLLGIHFPMNFGWHKGILNISFFLSSLFTGTLCLPSNCLWFFIDTTLFSASVFFLEGAPHLTAHFDWLPPVTVHLSLTALISGNLNSLSLGWRPFSFSAYPGHISITTHSTMWWCNYEFVFVISPWLWPLCDYGLNLFIFESDSDSPLIKASRREKPSWGL